MKTKQLKNGRGGKSSENKSAKASKNQKKKAPRNTVLDKAVLDNEVFRVGDNVYVVVDETLLGSQLDDEEDECYSCGICGSAAKRQGKLLECSKCLGGFHLGCLNPPLKQIPEGDWVCPTCSQGRAPRLRSIKCARERLLQQRGLALARIMSIWIDGKTGWIEFTAQWYNVPEETHLGRQHHHIAREVFLSRSYDTASIESILRHAQVIPMAEYNRCGEINDDVFVCDYEYDSIWQRFRRYAPWDALGDDGMAEYDDWDNPAHAGHSDDEDCDATFTMMDAMVSEKGSKFGYKLGGGSGGGKGRKRIQGGQDFQVQLGTRAIPEHVRNNGASGSNGRTSAALNAACHALTLAATPQSLPCREEEHQNIETFVEQVLANADDGKGRCLYISGIPGTGKTATVLQVMRSLREQAQNGEIKPFQFVEINGLRLPSPQHAYSTLYEALTGNILGPNAAAAALEDIFCKPRKSQHTIVMLDELDSLVNRTQTVLYNLFDWPSRPGSNLTIIGIANTMDLPERLHPRIGSRLAGRRLVFHPYQRDQLETIMRTRLGHAAFEPNAITLVARKVANCSGDVRRCLELCRRAAEIATKRHLNAKESGEVKVKIRDVDNAIREAFNTPHTNMVRESSKLERLLLAAIHLESRYTGRLEVVLENVANRLTGLCDNKAPPFMAVLQCAVSLAARRIILCDGGHKRLKANVALNVPSDDLIFVLINDGELSWLADRLK
jgi:origin recognition complex subunit 1